MRLYRLLLILPLFVIEANASDAWDRPRRDHEVWDRDERSHRDMVVILGWDRRPHEAESLFREGQTLFEQSRFEAALTKFRAAALADPELPGLTSYMIRSESEFNRERRLKMAQPTIDEIDRLNTAADTKMGQKKFKEAAELYEQTLRRDPENAEVKTKLKRAKDSSKAKRDPAAAEDHYRAGLIAYSSGNLDSAQQEMRLTVQLNPDHLKAASAVKRLDREIALAKAVQSQ